MILKVLEVLAVVISSVTAPPFSRLQPPKVYPALLVETTRVKATGERASESALNLPAISSLGMVVARVFPSKTTVGFCAVFAYAGALDAKPVIARAATNKALVDLAIRLFCGSLIRLVMFPSKIRTSKFRLRLALVSPKTSRLST
jgi:hypothetical protein